MNTFIDKLIEEAKKAYKEGNVPVGAVIVRNNKIISSNHNRKNSNKISIYHAELLCIIDACKILKSWYLDDCIMFVTLKPCQMCLAAIAESRISKVYYLLESNYSTNMDTNIANINLEKLSDDHEYLNLLSSFFREVRK